MGVWTGRRGGRQPPGRRNATRLGRRAARALEATAPRISARIWWHSSGHMLTHTHTRTYYTQAFSPAPAFAKASATAQAAYADSLAAALQARGAALPEIKVAPTVSVVVCVWAGRKEGGRERGEKTNPTSRPHRFRLSPPSSSTLYPPLQPKKSILQEGEGERFVPAPPAPAKADASVKFDAPKSTQGSVALPATVPPPAPAKPTAGLPPAIIPASKPLAAAQPAPAPKPAAASVAAAAAPVAAPAPKPITAKAATPAPAAAAPAESPNAIILAGVAAAGVAAVAFAASQQSDAAAAGGAAPAAAIGASSPPPAAALTPANNAAEARAWIAAWRARQGKTA